MKNDRNYEMQLYKTVKEKNDAIASDSENIKYIRNPSKKMKLDAVSQDCFSIKYIKNPSEKVQLASVKNMVIVLII